MSNRLERSLSQSSVNSQDSVKEIVPIEIPHRLRSRSRSALPRSRATSGSAGTLLHQKPPGSNHGTAKPHQRTSIVSKDPSLSSIESGSSMRTPHKLKKEDSADSDLPVIPLNDHGKSVSESSDSRNSVAAVKIDLHREQHEDEHADPKGSIYDDDFVDDLLESSSQAVQAKVKKFLRRHDPQDDQRAAPSLKLKNILANLSRKDEESNLEGLHIEKDRRDRSQSGVSHLLDGILTLKKYEDNDKHEKKHSRMHSGLLDSIIDTTKRIASLKSLEPSLFGILTDRHEKDVLEGKTPEATTEMDMVDFLASTSPLGAKQKTPSFKKSLPELLKSSFLDKGHDEQGGDEIDNKATASTPISKRLDSLSGSQEMSAANASGSPLLKRLHDRMVSSTHKPDHHAQLNDHELPNPINGKKCSYTSKSNECDMANEMDMLLFLSSTSPSESVENSSPLLKQDSSNASPNLKSTLAHSPSKCDLDDLDDRDDPQRRGSNEHHHEWHFPKFYFSKEASDAGSVASSFSHSKNLSKRPRGISETFKFSNSDNMSRNNSEHSLFDKYGKADNIIGKGAQATVRVVSIFVKNRFIKKTKIPGGMP